MVFPCFRFLQPFFWSYIRNIFKYTHQEHLPFNKSHSIKSPSSDSSMFASSFVVDFYPPYISFSFFTLKSLFVRVESPAIQIHHVHSFSSFPIPKPVPKKHVLPCRNQQKCTKEGDSPIRNTSSISTRSVTQDIQDDPKYELRFWKQRRRIHPLYSVFDRSKRFL